MASNELVLRSIERFNAEKDSLKNNSWQHAAQLLKQIMVHEAMLETNGNASQASELLMMGRQMFYIYLGTTVQKWKWEYLKWK